jgi:uncharacterized protein with ParB-like and HNH nuclease domain
MPAAQSAFQTPLTIGVVIENIDKRRYFLPAIQREFVWGPEKITKLFDSLMREYPIGSFLYWDVQKEKIKDFQFYDFVRKFSEKVSTHNPKANVTGEQGITCILDGQQRLTSLFIGLKGTYAEKIPWKRWDNPEAFPPRKLYLNLLSPAKNPEEMTYDFRFLTSEEAAQNDESTFWFEMGNILEIKEEYEVNNYLIDKGLNQKPKEMAKFANQTLFKAFSVFHKTPVINYYLETSQELDKVLQIFIRVNSQGVPLSYSDLLLSIATARWKTTDAREEITSFVDDINRIGESFDFDKDFVLKSCLVLSDITDIAFKVDNFNISNMRTIEIKWDDITKAIRLAIELISGFGYNFETLTSNNAVIPIAYYIMKSGNPNGFALSSHYKEDREKIRKWLTTSLIKRSFSGQPDNVLRPIRETVRNNTGAFPFNAIVEQFRRTNKSITFTDDDIQGLLEAEYGEPHTFSVLSLLYPTLDFRNRFHEDHIFPKKRFKKPALKKNGIPESKWEEFQANCNRLGNLQLLEGLPNEEKSGKDFKEWIETTYPDQNDRKEFMTKNFIPEDADLRFKNFLQVFAKRNELITNRLKQILQT